MPCGGAAPPVSAVRCCGFWQLVTDESVVGYLTASVTSGGVTCSVYRSYEMTYTG
jgi:hypothetical protein